MDSSKVLEILEVLTSINKKVKRASKFSPPFKCKNKSQSAMKVMFHIMNGPPMTLKELSSLVGLANSTVCGIIDELEKEGYVKRIQDNEDRRRVIIIPTEKAELEKRNIENKFKEFLVHVLKDISDEDFEIIINGLKKLDEIIKK